MAASPAYKVFCDGSYIAAFKRFQDAVTFVNADAPFNRTREYGVKKGHRGPLLYWVAPGSM